MGALPLFAAALPREYALPLAAIFIHLLFLTWVAFQVGGSRRRLNKPYPIVCDPPAAKGEPQSLFNCYVRAQLNIIENLPTHLCLLAMSSLTTPVASAAAGVLYTASRAAYFSGYVTGDPAKRMRGNFGCTLWPHAAALSLWGQGRGGGKEGGRVEVEACSVQLQVSSWFLGSFGPLCFP